MSETYPPDVREFMRQQLESGEYRSQEELFVAALRALRVVADHHHLLRADIHAGLLDLDGGKGEPWDLAALRDELGNHLGKAA